MVLLLASQASPAERQPGQRWPDQGEVDEQGLADCFPLPFLLCPSSNGQGDVAAWVRPNDTCFTDGVYGLTATQQCRSCQPVRRRVGPPGACLVWERAVPWIFCPLGLSQLRLLSESTRAGSGGPC